MMELIHNVKLDVGVMVAQSGTINPGVLRSPKQRGLKGLHTLAASQLSN